MPLRLIALIGGLGTVAGAIFGFVRGLGYLPTLPAAIVEGAVLFGAPASIIGSLAAGLWWVTARGARAMRARAHAE